MTPELKAELAQLVDYYRNAYGEKALITLRAIINGKLSRRKITPEQQAKMQAGRTNKTTGGVQNDKARA